MTHRLGWLTATTLFFFFLLTTPSNVRAGNTTCVGTMLDWYTNAVGESPCMTYQRLRQICDPTYQVPSFRSNTPGDNCDTQLNSCCCNSISWALSMLCMNCQQDVIGGSSNGIDAGVGAYQMYLTDGTMCSSTNQSLPTEIQSAVCNSGIKLDDFLYNIFWGDGAWYYVYTSETAQEDQVANNNNTFSHCPNAIVTSTISSSSSTSAATGAVTGTPLPSQTPSVPTVLDAAKSSNMGAIIGGAVGGVAALAALLIALYFLRRGKRHSRADALDMDAAVPTFRSSPNQTQLSSLYFNPFTASDRAPTTIVSSYMDHNPQFLSSSGSDRNALSSEFSSTAQTYREDFVGPLRPNVLGYAPVHYSHAQEGSRRQSPFTDEPRVEEPRRAEGPQRAEEPQRAEPRIEEDAGTLISYSQNLGSIPPPYNPAWDMFQKENEKTDELLAGSSTGPGSSA